MSGWVREPRLGQLSGGLLVGKIGAAERRRLAIAGERVPVLRFWAPLRTGRDSGCHPAARYPRASLPATIALER
jgi:hypothetical protein